MSSDACQACTKTSTTKDSLKINKLEIANVTTRIAMEEEIKALEETTLDWQTNDRLTALRYTVAALLSNEPTNEVIINLKCSCK